MIQKHLLKDIGLTNNEAELYILLLKLNEAIASTIAKKIKISRPHVYDSLNKLIDKGMATYIIKNGKKYFKPTDPAKILDYLREKETDLKEKQKTIKKALPELNALFQPLKAKPQIEIYEGPEGIKTILSDMIRIGKEMIAFNTIGDKILNYLPKYVILRYYAERKRKKIRSRQFYSKDVQLLKHPMATYKKLPNEYNPVLLFVYGDNVCMFILIDNPLTIKIKSKEVARLYKNQFEYMWKIIK